MLGKEPVEEIIELQRRVDRDRHQYDLDAWMHLHMGIGQIKALFYIYNRGCTTSGKLAAAMDVTPPNVIHILDRLLEKDLITRTRDSHDRRVFLLRITPRGEELVAGLRRKRKERMTELFNRLTNEEAAIVTQALKLMVKVIEADQNDLTP
jgi:DNA-binding MarR family transcriptional regulator